MQFISFIASAMLIVLISQQSIMALPINGTVMEKSCSNGFKLVEGHCILVNPKPNDLEKESTPLITEAMIIDKNDFVAVEASTINTGGCPEGMKHGKYGLCNKIESFETTEATFEATTDVDRHSSEEELLKDCPKGTKLGKNGICQKIKLFQTTEATFEATTDVDRHLSGEKLLKDCPKGTKLGKNGLCKKIELFETTEATFEATTDIDRQLGEEELPKGCPEGTKYDEQGACQEITPSNSTKMVIDFKSQLKNDGSCPDNYKMIQGRCLYIKPKTNSTLFSSSLTADDNVPNNLRSKNVNNGDVKPEFVPVLRDNSCPEGTEYSEYGLCQKRVRPSGSGIPVTSGSVCPVNYEFINGKCTQKKFKPENLFDFTTDINKSKSTIPNVESFNTDESTFTTKPTIVGKLRPQLPRLTNPV